MSNQTNNLHRVVYILNPVGRNLECVVKITKLMKWEAFREVDFSNLRDLFHGQYASYVRPEDRAIVMGLMQMVKRKGAFSVLEAGEYGYEVFRKMLDTGRLFFKNGKRLRLRWEDERKGELRWESLPNGTWRPRASLTKGGTVFALNPPVYIDGGSCVCGGLDLGVPSRLAMRWIASRWMGEAAVSDFCLRLAKEFPECSFPVPECARLDELGAIKPVAVIAVQPRVVTQKREKEAVWVDLHNRLRLRLRFRYGGALVDWDSEEKAVSYREEGAIKRVSRDFARECEVKKNVEVWGFSEEGGGDLGCFNFDSALFVLGEGFSWREFMEEVFPSLDRTNWEFGFSRGFKLSLANEDDVFSDTNEENKGWFSVDLGVEVEGRKVSLLPLLHQALKGQGKRKMSELLAWLREGSFAARMDVQEGGSTKDWLVSLPGSLLARVADDLYEVFDRKSLGTGARARVNQWRLGELVAAGLFAERAEDSLREIVRLCERLKGGLAVVPRAAPVALRANLRSYQESGLGWLHALSEVSAGGILADDMGLGKTVQTIAHLLELKERGGLEKGVLIVAPTSVIDNWGEELERFAPGLSVAMFYGKNREVAWADRERIDVMITSYSLLRLEIDRLREWEWNVAILDEAQYVKNAHSRTSMAARLLRAERRLCLTGTPIENRLEDIWALFEFLLPGFLGEEETFRQRLSKTLSEDADSEFAAELRGRLRRRLAPFVLRRLKGEVLEDLPEKTEVDYPVSMAPAQYDLYESMRKQASDGIRRELQSKGMAGARILILARLLRLRQICCDPRLIEEGRSLGVGPSDSGKLLALMELLEKLEEQGSRTLIFSQFTSMLDLIAEALDESGREYLMLTGSSKNRGELVRQFQEGECPLFLISLRAGGSGLNLTAADSVIHYDPWWNPAVERQATDRAHRIGQGKPVFVYKLVADDSIESKILHLQKQKLELVEGLLSEGDVDRLEMNEDTLDFLLGD